MEWRFYYIERSYAKTVVERRTAVVQVADSNGLILVIQICNMNRMSFFFAVIHSLLTQKYCAC